MKNARLKLYNLFLLSLVFAFPSDNTLVEETDWKLKETKENISIYTRNVDYSRINELKMTTTVKSDINTIINVLNDVESYPGWMHGCRSVEVTKTIAENKHLNWTILNFPDPLSDRSVLAETTVVEHELTGTVSIESKAIVDKSYEKKGVVMIENMTSSWYLTPVGNGEVRIDSYLFCDPGGNIPAWLVNRILPRGPFKTVVNLRRKL